MNMLLSILNNNSFSMGNTFYTNPRMFYSSDKSTISSSTLDLLDATSSSVNLPSFAATAPKVFLHPDLEQKEISSFLKGKTGIYCFWNKSNGKLYVGSGVELSRRVNLYFQNSWLNRHSNMIIVNAILKYGIYKT
jgi:hypothetical protein